MTTTVSRTSTVRVPVTMRRFGRQRLAVLALIVLTIFVAVAALSSVISPYPPEQTDLTSTLNGPSAEHILGTDDLGRDVLSRVLQGTRISLLAALQATAFAVCVGIPLGIIAGYFGGLTDTLLSRFADAFMTFPALLLAIVIIGINGPGLTNAMLAIGVVYAPRLFRVARASTLSVTAETYVKAARTLGATNLRILLRNVVPNSLSPVLVQVSLTMGTAILAEGSLSFLGLGVQAPETSWGAMLGRGVAYLMVQPLIVVVPGILISIAVLSFNILGDGLRDSIGRERRS